MVPCSRTRVLDLPPNAKLCEMQQNMHALVQLIRAATPDVPNQTPTPKVSKELLNACPIPPMHVIVQLLPGYQTSILSSNEWRNDMNPAFIAPSWPQPEKQRNHRGYVTVRTHPKSNHQHITQGPKGKSIQCPKYQATVTL